MDSATREKILQAAVQIGEELLAVAEKDNSGISWQSMGMDAEQKITWKKDDNIYSGVAGIALFFLELYRHTQQEKYFSTAKEAMRWVEDYYAKNPTIHYAFFTGRMGIAYALIQLYQQTKEKKYLETALNIGKDSRNFLNAYLLIDDLINGISGTLLGLLHLHAATKDEQLLTDIDFFTDLLIKRAYTGKQGLYWDRSDKNVRGLCGFSHGSGGIGFVFLELGNYFGNKAFHWLAQQAFDYEDYFFDKKINNWQDFRRGIFSDKDREEHEQAFLKNDLEFFTKGNDMNAWCHGAAGIGLARMRANELLGKKEYRKEIDAAIEKNMAAVTSAMTEGAAYILCHGGGGNADIFLEAYRRFGEEKYMDVAEQVALRAIASREKRGMYISGFHSAGREEDTSLFMGKAGVGYFYLRVLDPHHTPSILLPELKSVYDGKQDLSAYPSIHISEGELKKRILEKCFHRTIAVAEKLFPEKTARYFNAQSQNGKSEKEQFAGFIDALIKPASGDKEKILADIFHLESEKMHTDDNIPSHSLLAVKEMMYSANAKKITETNNEEFLNRELIADKDIQVQATHWNWSMDAGNDWLNNMNGNGEEEEYPVLLKPAVMGVEEHPLNMFSHAILDYFLQPQKVKDVVDGITGSFENLADEEKETVKSSVIRQIKEFIALGIIKQAME